MNKLLKFTGVFLTCVLLVGQKLVLAQASYPPNDPNGHFINLTMQYDTANNIYQVFGIPNFTSTATGPGQFKISNGSIVTIVVPDSVDDAPFSVSSAPGSGGIWEDLQVETAPAAMPNKDFHAIIVTPTNTNIMWVAGVAKLLFSFEMVHPNCVPGVRLFINATDPKSTAPGMNNNDYENYIGKASVIGSQFYNINVDSAEFSNLGGINCNYPLPPLSLEFKSFNVVATTDCEAILTWEVVSDKSITGYEVLSSHDNGSWQTIAEVDAINGKELYKFTDKRGLQGAVSYKVKTLFAQGGYAVSDVRAISNNCGITHNATVFPNPAVNEITVAVYASAATAVTDNISLSIFDITGKLVLSTDVAMANGVATKTFDISHLANGNYMVQYKNAKRQYTGSMKFLKETE